ncbi:MAG: HAD family phosphatase [Clostridiales Family XIII bacterium]|jgi:HAD superfamily hydrolase (TIGR01509 family)|nr:HAD family phosphatase [Clostridiales Family XIII bacterium]
MNEKTDLSKIAAVVFDMDGLMFDSERLAREGWHEATQNHGIEIPDSVIDQTIGLTCSEMRSLVQKYFDSEGIDVDAAALHRERNELATDRVEREGAPIKPGLYELIAHIEKKGLRAAVASAASPRSVETLIRKANLTDAFEEIVHGGDAKNGKPNPEIFLITASRLGLSPEECLVLEDSANGVLAAHAAGMPVIMIPDQLAPTDEIRALATKVLPTLHDVIPLL